MQKSYNYLLYPKVYLIAFMQFLVSLFYVVEASDKIEYTLEYNNLLISSNINIFIGESDIFCQSQIKPIPINRNNYKKQQYNVVEHAKRTLKISLSNQDLNIIPYNVFECHNLQYLDLSNNNLTKLP